MGANEIILILLGLAIIILTGFFLFKIFSNSNPFTVSFAKVIISIVTFQLVITEILSFLGRINYYWYLAFYIVSVFLAGIIYFKKYSGKTDAFFVRKLYCKVPKIYKIIILLLVSNAALIVFTSLFYPPNNWDSATCWLARMEHWIQNGSMNYFPTHFHLQNVHQPLSSIIFLNIRLITDSYLFLNLTQLFFLIGTSFILIELANPINKSLKFKLVIITLVLTIPIAVLQASSTKNDLIISFFFVAAIYFLRRIIEEQGLGNIVWFSITVALAVLTKFSILPFLFIFLSYYCISLFVKDKKKAIYFFLISSAVLILLISPYLSRNYFYSGNILGNSQLASNRDMKEEMQGKSKTNTLLRTFSVIVKYISYELSTPSKFINKQIETGVLELDKILKLKEDDVLHSDYVLDRGDHYNEDSKNNLFFFSIILLTIPWAIRQKNSFSRELILLSVISFIFFCVVFPIYDIARGRYMLPLLLLLTIPSAQFLLENFNIRITISILLLLILNSILVSYRSELRPFPPIMEIRQTIKSIFKQIPNKFSNQKDYVEMYSKCDTYEKLLLDKIYDENGINRGMGLNENEKNRCFNIMLKYHVINSGINYDRNLHLPLNISRIQFKEMTDYINQNKIKDIGLYVSKNFQEFSLWYALNANKEGIKIQAVKVNDYYFTKVKDFNPQYILVFERPDYCNILSNYIVDKKFDDIFLLKAKE